MIAPACVCIHSLAQARRALDAAIAAAQPVTLISAPGAASYAGCGWWRAVIAAAAEQALPDQWDDLLDCADAAGHAMAALRHGQRRIILYPTTPALAAVQAAARTIGADLLTLRPPALDLADPAAARHLAAWLSARAAPG